MRIQNLLILIGSFVFYGWTNWKFLLFLIGVTLFNYILGIYIEKTISTKQKKILLYIGLLQGVGGLAYFKYYNFFITSINQVIQKFGFNVDLATLNIIIPLGISFFTFRTISYTLDVYNGKIDAVKDWVVFFNYVAFFPSILSGPIDKARDLVPQLQKERHFNYNFAVDGLRQILWGLFKKIVIANNCSPLVNDIFENYNSLPASSLFIGSFLFSIQIYADFSGYSDIAIGIAKLLGFTITKNFNFPYFSQNIAEFWRKWHMSLTSWVTEYVFSPLSIFFRDYGKYGLFYAIMINLLVVGIWHGANWTFVLYGFVHGLLFIPLIVSGTMFRNKKQKVSRYNNLLIYLKMIKTFVIVMLTMIIFKVNSITDAFLYYKSLFSKSFFSMPKIDFSALVISLFFIFMMLVIEWINKSKEHGLQLDNVKNVYQRWILYFFILSSLLVFGAFNENQFIYFKF